MALQWKFQDCRNFLCMVWVILTLGISTSPAKSENIQTYLTDSNKNNIVYHLTKRETEVDIIQDSVSEDKLDDVQQVPDTVEHVSQEGDYNKNISFQEYDEDSSTDQTKLKQNNKQKYVTSDFKNYGSNKFNVDPKHLLSNDSSNDKAKLYSSQGGYVSKYINPDKKVTKLSSNQSDYILKSSNSNSTLLNHYTNDKINASSVTEIQINSTSTKAVDESERLNITHELSDQPVGTNNDNSHNTTELADDDSLGVSIQNTTDFQNERSSNTSAHGRVMPASATINILVISGIILGSVALIGLMAGGGFVVYRHRIWNKPQTLSDKCSNADSSGYIDDSTLRENSEEMYSLDNDSFLNSLEAMTIQNYWTDNVKHTKL